MDFVCWPSNGVTISETATALNFYWTIRFQRAVADLTELDDRQRATAGVNRDGSVTIADVTKLQRYLAEFITEL